jgi:hypothetical protein
MIVTISAYIFMVLASVVFLFQVALAAGAPWGEITMGGRFPGQLPPRMRGVAIFSAALILGFGLVVAVRAGFLLPQWQPISTYLVWGIVAYFVLGVVAHLFTPSRWERIIWLPVIVVMLVSSMIVALS